MPVAFGIFFADEPLFDGAAGDDFNAVVTTFGWSSKTRRAGARRSALALLPAGIAWHEMAGGFEAARAVEGAARRGVPSPAQPSAPEDDSFPTSEESMPPHLGEDDHDDDRQYCSSPEVVYGED